VNQDGVIQYDEFIPAAMAILRARKQEGITPMPRIQDVPSAMLERYFKKLFAVADVNGDGVLQPSELQRLLELSGFSFSPEQIMLIVESADVNQDGVIQYSEFVPVATQLLLQQQEDMDTYIMTQDEAAAEQFILQGMSTEELLRTMKKVFLEADTDNSGYLDEYEF